MEGQTRLSRGENQRKKYSKSGVESWGLGRRAICVESFGSVNHRPKFFVQLSHTFRRTRNSPSFAPDFAPVLAQPAGFPLCTLSAFNQRKTKGQQLNLLKGKIVS